MCVCCMLVCVCVVGDDHSDHLYSVVVGGESEGHQRWCVCLGYLSMSSSRPSLQEVSQRDAAISRQQLQYLWLFPNTRAEKETGCWEEVQLDLCYSASSFPLAIIKKVKANTCHPDTCCSLSKKQP